MGNGMPNFEQIAAAYNINGITISSNELFKSEYLKLLMLSKNTLIVFNIIENENCYPMVAPGRSNSQMIGLKIDA
jgi:acetolactate synthase-1/2/3 large subunit